MMSRPTKAELDAIEAQEAQIEAELQAWDDMDIARGHIPGYSQFGFPEDDDYAAYMGPVIANPVENEADMDSSPEDWKEFLRKIEEDLK
jgi:hypothetical protein